MSEFIINLIQELLKSRFCQGENYESASNASFLEKALDGGVEYEMIKDCDSVDDIMEVIESEREMIRSFSPDDDDC